MHFNEDYPRQREVLRRVSEGSSTKEIARVLDLRPKAVDIHDVADLTRFAVRVGLVSTEWARSAPRAKAPRVWQQVSSVAAVRMHTKATGPEGAGLP